MSNWIKLRTDLFRDPAVFRMAVLCRTTPHHIVGQLSDIWGWLGGHTTDGTCKNVSPDMLDMQVHTPGFADAMLQVGWLQVENDTVIIPKWDRHNSSGSKARALEAEAKQLRRTCVRQNTPEMSDQIRGDKIREEYNTPVVPKGTMATPGAALPAPGSPAPNPSSSNHVPSESTTPPPKTGSRSAQKKKEGAVAALRSLVEQIYLAYPKHIAPVPAKRAIDKALRLDIGGDDLLAKVRAYAEAVQQWPEADRRFIPHPSTWFNAGRYHEHASEWQRGSNLATPLGSGKKDRAPERAAVESPPEFWGLAWPQLFDDPCPGSWELVPEPCKPQLRKYSADLCA